MKKIFKYTLFLTIGFVVLLAVLSKVFENQISDIAIKKLSDSFNVPIKLGEVNFNLIRKFPYASIEFTDLIVGEHLVKEESSLTKNSSDTLIYIERMYVSVRSSKLISGIVVVEKVDVDGLKFKYLVDSRGQSNVDFLIDTNTVETDTVEVNALNLLLKDLELKNVNCIYQDSTSMTQAHLNISNIEVQAELNDSLQSAVMLGEFNIGGLEVVNTNLYKFDKANLQFDLKYINDTVLINDLNIAADEFKIHVDGKAVLDSIINVGLNYKVKDVDIAKLIKYAPDTLLPFYGVRKASGRLDMHGSVNGPINDSLELPRLISNISLSNARIKTNDYPEIKNLSFNIRFDNGSLRNNKTTEVNIRSLHIQTPQSSIKSTAKIANIDKLKYNLNLQADVFLDEFVDLIPDSTLESLSGNIVADIKTKGVLPDNIDTYFFDDVLASTNATFGFKHVNAEVDSSLSINNLTGKIGLNKLNFSTDSIRFKVPEQKLIVEDLSLRATILGSLGNIESLGANLKSFNLSANGVDFKCNGELVNLNTPNYKIDGDLTLNLGELQTFIPDSLVDNISGDLFLKMKSSGSFSIDSIAAKASELALKNSWFNLQLKDLNVSTPDTLIGVEEFNGTVDLTPEQIELKAFKGKYKKLDFWLDSMLIFNAYEALILRDSTLLVDYMKVGLGHVDYDYVMTIANVFAISDSIAKLNTEDKTEESQLDSMPPVDYKVRGKLFVESAKYEGAYLEDISGKFLVTDSLYIIDKLNLSAFNGKMSNSVKYTVRPNGEVWISMRNDIDKMDVNKLLVDFKNFRDYYTPVISHKNISGLLSLKLDHQYYLYDNKFSTEDMRVRGDILLEKGIIKNYQPLMDAKTYLPGINDLSNVEFKNINSSVFLFKEAIYFPETNIYTNKFDAGAFGMQGLGDEYSYHLEVFLADLLTGKSKKVTKKQDKQGDEVKDSGRKQGTLLRYYSENGKDKIGKDTPTERSIMSKKIKASRRLLEFRFNRIVNYETGVKN